MQRYSQPRRTFGDELLARLNKLAQVREGDSSPIPESSPATADESPKKILAQIDNLIDQYENLMMGIARKTETIKDLHKKLDQLLDNTDERLDELNNLKSRLSQHPIPSTHSLKTLEEQIRSLFEEAQKQIDTSRFSLSAAMLGSNLVRFNCLAAFTKASTFQWIKSLNDNEEQLIEKEKNYRARFETVQDTFKPVLATSKSILLPAPPASEIGGKKKHHKTVRFEEKPTAPEKKM